MPPTVRSVPHVDDTADLAQRIESGASVRTIAAELDVTERTVRNRLRRAGIPLPSVRKAAGVDLEAVLADYRDGMPVRTIAERHQVGETWVRRRSLRTASHATCRSNGNRRHPATPSSPTVGGCSSGWPTAPASTPSRRNCGPAPAPSTTPCDATGSPGRHHRRPRRAARLHRRRQDPDAAAQRIIDEATALAERARAVRDARPAEDLRRR